jgi:hypothetical protein
MDLEQLAASREIEHAARLWRLRLADQAAQRCHHVRNSA